MRQRASSSALRTTSPTPAAAPPEEIAEILAPHPIFARFDRAMLLAVAAQCHFATYPAGATIMREGEPGDFACAILEGDVDIVAELPTGPIHMATVGRHRGSTCRATIWRRCSS